ncbi:MAG: alpha/beta fold hydrolase [Candidatus Melainabacteria bacterium]|nr:alpha/beta fold hydrolase [Candidatus Melainabacteria bacterium]
MGRNMYLNGLLTATVALACLVSTASPSFAQVARDDDPTIGRGLVTPVRQWRDATQDPRGVILLIHGFPEHSLLYDKLASRLAFDGFVVYAPDLRGLGRAYANEIATKIDYAKHADNDVAQLAERIRKEHKGLKMIVGGESMGGALAIRLAATRPDLVDGVILSGPALKLERHYARLIPSGLVNVLTLGAVKVDFTKQIETFFSADARIGKELACDPLVRKKFDTRELIAARRFPQETEKFVDLIPAKTPVFVLQACDDRQVNPKGLYMFDAKLRSNDVTYVLYSYGGHTILQTRHLDSFAEKSVIEWLERQVPPLEGGACRLPEKK